MGWKYEVLAWIEHPDGGYYNKTVYTGQSLFGAIRAMRKAKKASGCVRLEWR